MTSLRVQPQPLAPTFRVAEPPPARVAAFAERLRTTFQLGKPAREPYFSDASDVHGKNKWVFGYGRGFITYAKESRFGRQHWNVRVPLPKDFTVTRSEQTFLPERVVKWALAQGAPLELEKLVWVGELGERSQYTFRVNGSALTTVRADGTVLP